MALSPWLDRLTSSDAPRSSMCSYHRETGACSAKSATNRLHKVATTSTKEARPTVRKQSRHCEKTCPFFHLDTANLTLASALDRKQPINFQMMEKFDEQRKKERKKERDPTTSAQLRV